jgi:hypothetical protein
MLDHPVDDRVFNSRKDILAFCRRTLSAFDVGCADYIVDFAVPLYLCGLFRARERKKEEEEDEEVMGTELKRRSKNKISRIIITSRCNVGVLSLLLILLLQ